MGINLDEIQYRIRTDYSFKKQLRKLVLIGGTGVLVVVVALVVGIVFFSSAIISYLFANVPGLFEIGFNYVRDFASSFVLKDLTTILNTLGGGTNVNEMKNLITQYSDRLSGNPNVDFQNFQNFISTVKNSVIDKKITDTELGLVKHFLMN